MRRLFLFSLTIALLFALAGSSRASAQGPSGGTGTAGTTWYGGKGKTETVAQIMQRGKNAPQAPVVSQLTPRRFKPSTAPASVSPQPAARQLAASPRAPASASPQTIGTSFLGAQLSEANPAWKPPDTMGAVGPSQIFFVENGVVKIFDKSGNVGGLNTTLDNFFASVRSASAFDPRTYYDRLSGRWFVSSLDFTNHVLLAVSSGSTITNQSSFTFYQFKFDEVGATPNADTGGEVDFDTLGVDANAVYIGVNVFSFNFGTTGFVIDKAALLTGSLTVTPFRQMAACIFSICGNGPYAPIGVDNDDPASTEGYFIGTDLNDSTLLTLRRITYPGGVPTISANLTVTVPAMVSPINVNVLSGTLPLDAVDSRLFNAMIKKNDLTGVSTLWTAQALEVDSSGTSVGGGGRDGARWYQLGNLTTTPALLQSGTLYDSAVSNPRSFFMPSVAMSGQGHMALGSSMASVNEYANIITAGRLASDPANSLQPFTMVLTGTNSYNIGAQNGSYRWGDYSQTVVDPTDDMTIWTFQEYAPSVNNWGVRAIQLIAPPPATITLLSPTSIPQGSYATSIIITGTSTAGSGFFDPGADPGGPGFANHIRATVTGQVVVNSITLNSPTQVTLNLNTVCALPGAQNVTIKNPDGQNVTAAGVLTITAAANTCLHYIFPLIFR